MQIFRFVVTGGPCGGKTTALAHVRRYFEEKGIGVVTVPETATELISSGISPWTVGSSFVYQSVQLRLQAEKERIYEYGASLLGRERVLLILDRGMLDNRAYLEPWEFTRAVSEMGLEEEDLPSRYHAVFHLVTAADGAEEFYTVENNRARTETAEEARALDLRLRDAWSAHPRLFVIGNEGGMEGKISSLIEGMESVIKDSAE